ncbi:hypothetical protein [Amycolatopsis sp. YIM 10]|uniref:hypothetical protein n=1 Tax=Amycolatopsis sp. YIM 10 TaxID=2653857 RepID=UPI0012901973|nr:hypothetical protein [Amycolatopsis sp. YIM 10]QFU90562.1 Putative NAD(P)H nitroreductase [Amycolatopsis sp. YIM 10]
MDVQERAPAGSPRGSAFEPWRTWSAHDGPAALVAAAVLAANARNVQPWKFRITDAGIDVFADPERVQGALDPYDRELEVSLGCAIENLVLAARANGYHADVRAPAEGGDGQAVSVLLRPGTREVSELYQAIPHRHTNRGPFTRRPLSADLLREIGGIGRPDLAAAEVKWFTTPAERAWIGAELIAATEAIIADEAQSRAGHRWVRGSRREIERNGDGMTVLSQGMHPLVAAVGSLLPAPSRRTADRFWLRNTKNVHVATAAAFAVLSVPDARSLADRIDGGRLLQRIHLLCTARGLGVGHLNMLTVRADRERETGGPPRFTRILAELLGDPAREVLCTCRIGYPVRKAVASPRRPLAAVLR